MTPAEIAKKLTPAQVRALRDGRQCTLYAYRSLRNFGRDVVGTHLILNSGFRTPLGDAVLAELDAKEGVNDVYR
jgi:hypothetical protein